MTLFLAGVNFDSNQIAQSKSQYRMRKSSLKLVKNEILEFQARIKPEGFYITGRHERSIERIVQRLHSSTPYCFLHADTGVLASYYTKLVVRKIELPGENLIVRFNPLRKQKLIDVLNQEIEKFSLDKALEATRPDNKRRIILIENEEELISEDWQDIELLCTGLPGINLGLICNASGIKKEVLATNQLMKNKRVFHAFFNSPTNSELRILSVVARQSPRNKGILKTLESLGLRYNAVQNADVKTNLRNKEIFDDHLKTAKSNIQVSSKGNWFGRLTKAMKFFLLLTVTALTLLALIILLD
tara:strand:- start:75 stop:977 length:903 start_codon:yes stop_codon:yes gene_type:complete